MIKSVSPLLPADRQRIGFTLIELLVVIAIIAVLMGLLFPVASGVMRAAKKTEATTNAQSIKAAIEGYYTEYGRFPELTTTPTDDTPLTTTQLENLYEILIVARDSNGNIIPEVKAANPRLIPFLSAKDAKSETNPRNGMSTEYLYMDPWGNPYNIAIDYDYNNVLTQLPAPYDEPDRPLRDSVAVASLGDPNTWEEDDEQNKKELEAISTWQ